MHVVEKCLIYYNKNKEYNVVYYDDLDSKLFLVNYNKESIKIFNDFKNMYNDMLVYISNDFDSFSYINHELNYIEPDIVKYLEENNCNDFLTNIKEDYPSILIDFKDR